MYTNVACFCSCFHLECGHMHVPKVAWVQEWENHARLLSCFHGHTSDVLYLLHQISVARSNHVWCRVPAQRSRRFWAMPPSSCARPWISDWCKVEVIPSTHGPWLNQTNVQYIIYIYICIYIYMCKYNISSESSWRPQQACPLAATLHTYLPLECFTCVKQRQAESRRAAPVVFDSANADPTAHEGLASERTNKKACTKIYKDEIWWDGVYTLLP